MSATGTIATQPGKRWADDEETITPAALDQTGAPVFVAGANSVGEDELIAADVIEIIEDLGAGISASFTFANDSNLPTGFLLKVGSISIPDAKRHTNGSTDPIAITQPRDGDALANVGADLNLMWFSAAVNETGDVWIYALQVSGSTKVIPNGTTILLRVFPGTL